jgi:molecular chaperone GrpE
MAKQKKSKDIDLDIDKSELPNEDVSPEIEMDIESNSNMGSDTYEELLDKNEDLEKASLRAKADLDNALKRTLSEVEKAHKYGVEKLLSELLPVIDNLEHALNNLSENATTEDKEGIELTLKSFESALDKFGMIPIYPVNEDFNPEKHEAVTMEKDKSKENGSIGNIFQRGWELHSRLVRPARVTVIKN